MYKNFLRRTNPSRGVHRRHRFFLPSLLALGFLTEPYTEEPIARSQYPTKGRHTDEGGMSQSMSKHAFEKTPCVDLTRLCSLRNLSRASPLSTWCGNSLACQPRTPPLRRCLLHSANRVPCTYMQITACHLLKTWRSGVLQSTLTHPHSDPMIPHVQEADDRNCSAVPIVSMHAPLAINHREQQCAVQRPC